MDRTRHPESLVGTRRRVLGTLAAGAALPLLGHAAPLRRVAVVGAGMAGIATAWKLNGAADVRVFEAAPSIGGNVQSVTVDLDGTPVVVDLGAQFFHPGPYPTYVQLLEQLGLYPPAAGGSRAFAATITVAAANETKPRFVSPLLPGRAWPLVAPFNRDGIQAFATALPAARKREKQDAPYELTLGDWLPNLGLSQWQWEEILLPWAASLFSGNIEEARGMSARAAMVFAAKALPLNPLDPISYYVLEPGMIKVLELLVAQFTTVQVATATPVTAVERNPAGGFVVHAGAAADVFDDVVFAASGGPTLALLNGITGTEAQRTALGAIEFTDARLMLHRDPVYASADPRYWSFLDSGIGIDGTSCEASMWMAPVLGVPQAALWKSWVTHRSELPSQVIPDTDRSFRHLLPTPASLAAQSALLALSGQGGVWFAGGYLYPYDSQETALLSALAVAGTMVPTASPRAARG